MRPFDTGTFNQQDGIEHNNEDVSFYKNKCINLESMVEEHIRINRFLKEQVERMRNDAHPTN